MLAASDHDLLADGLDEAFGVEFDERGLVLFVVRKGAEGALSGGQRPDR